MKHPSPERVRLGKPLWQIRAEALPRRMEQLKALQKQHQERVSHTPVRTRLRIKAT